MSSSTTFVKNTHRVLQPARRGGQVKTGENQKPQATSKKVEVDKTIWKKNWFDVGEELPYVKYSQRHAMLSSYISKINAYPHEDTAHLIYILRVRALIIIFFGLEIFESGIPAGTEYRDHFERWDKFVRRDLSIHNGWTDDRTNEEDDIIGKYQLSYALSVSGKDKEAGDAFTLADKMFGLVRHRKYLIALNENENR
jgi:hypothetical protein